MTEQSRAFTDEELTAFLDGEAGDADMRAIEAALSTDEALAERVLMLDIPKAEIAASFDALLARAPAMPDLPPPLALPPSTEDTAPKSNVVPMAAARRRWVGPSLGLGTGIAAGIAMALGFGWSLQEPAAPVAQKKGWIATVAQYQMLYTPQTLMASGPAQPDSLASVSEAVGLDLTALGSVEGLTFHRAQELGFNGKALIQISYTLPDGTPFAICILRSDKPQGQTRVQTVEGMAAADFNTGTHGVLLIGGQDQGVVETLAPKVGELL